MQDVIVVGAGPAGNNLALELASLGHGVTVVDSRERIGDKLCTGIVGKECLQRFPLDGSTVYRDARGARLVAPDGKALDFVRDDVQAHVLDRVSYVASFARRAIRAIRAGAQYMLGQRVLEVSTDDDGASVQVSDGEGRRTLRARALVLASGFGSDLTGQMGLGKVGDFATAVQAEVMAPEVDRIHVYFGRDTAPGSFAWLVPTREGRALVGLLCRHRGHAHLENLLLRLQA